MSDSHSGTKTYYLVYLALLALLVVTVAIAYVHLGSFNIAVAMLVATVKSIMVMWYFMHMNTSPRLVPIFVGLSLLMLFVGALFFFADYMTRVA